MTFTTRCSGVVFQDGHLLLVRQVIYASQESWWGLPGGGREPGETDEEAVRREVREETGLEVRVERLLFDQSVEGRGKYDRYKTFLCVPISGEAQAGTEPGSEGDHGLAGIRWLDIRNESSWEEELCQDAIMGPLLRQIRRKIDVQP